MNKLVRREKAADYVLLVVISFAITEIGVRLFLLLANYPEIAFWNLHIAHVLWGGLFMFVGSMLILIFSNTSMLRVSAILTGSGMSLFIDEIGKFITRKNDYFFGPALPLIYISFLLVFLVYMYLKKTKRETPREMFYDVLDDCKDILDFELDPLEKLAIEKKLATISASETHKDIRGFAKSLQRYLKSMDYQKGITKNHLFEVFSVFREKVARLAAFHKIVFFILMGLVTLSGIDSIMSSIRLGVGVFQSKENTILSLQQVFQTYFPDMVTGRIDIYLLTGMALIELFVGIVIIIGIVAILTRRASGIHIIKFAIVFSLCSSDIILLYYNQVFHFPLMLIKLATIGYITFYEQLYFGKSGVALPPAK